MWRRNALEPQQTAVSNLSGPQGKTIHNRAGVQILASLDSKWTPRDLFRDMEAPKHFRMSMFIGVCFGGPGEIRTHDLFHAI